MEGGGGGGGVKTLWTIRLNNHPFIGALPEIEAFDVMDD